MRVVFDTNVLISACWSPGGLEARLVRLAAERTLALCVTEAVLAEYREVAERPKFASRRACFERMLAELDAAAESVQPGLAATAASDPDDNQMLECADGAGAQWLITGNLRHFPAEWQGARVANARQFFTANPGLLEPEFPSAGS